MSNTFTAKEDLVGSCRDMAMSTWQECQSGIFGSPRWSLDHRITDPEVVGPRHEPSTGA